MRTCCLALIFLPIVSPAISGPALAAQQPSSDAPRQHLLTGELAHAIDAKKAKVGDKVTLRLVDDVYSNGKVIVPYTKGKVIGHISQVQPSTKETPQSTVAIEFDRIEVKGGRDLPITATIQSMMPPDHHMVRSSGGSVPTSGDDPMARAAGPMVDSSGRAVIPAHAPVTQSGPRAAASDYKFSGMDGIQLEPNSATHTTVISSDRKGIYIDSDTRMRLSASSTTF